MYVCVCVCLSCCCTYGIFFWLLLFVRSRKSCALQTNTRNECEWKCELFTRLHRKQAAPSNGIIRIPPSYLMSIISDFRRFCCHVRFYMAASIIAQRQNHIFMNLVRKNQEKIKTPHIRTRSYSLQSRCGPQNTQAIVLMIVCGLFAWRLHRTFILSN